MKTKRVLQAGGLNGTPGPLFQDAMRMVGKLEENRNGSASATAKPADQPLLAGNGKPQATKPVEVPAPPAKKLSLGERLRQATTNKDVQELRAVLTDARLNPQAILDYVNMRWEINRFEGMSDGWAAKSWEEQVEILRPKAKRSMALKIMIDTVEDVHANSFARETVTDVMNRFGIPLQEVENIMQLKNFLDRVSKQGDTGGDLVEAVKNPRHQPENGITILDDPADSTNDDEVIYLPKNGCKVAIDAWLVVRQKYDEAMEKWSEFEALRSMATARLTAFRASNSRDGRRGPSGNLFVMPGSGNWALVLKISDDPKGRRTASVIKSVGLEQKDVVNLSAEWNHKGHCLYGSDRVDAIEWINSALEEINERQHQRVVIDMEESRNAFESLKMSATLDSEPKDQGLHRILDGTDGTVTVCLQTFSLRKNNGKIKTGYFGVAVTYDLESLVITEVTASECFQFQKGLIGKKLMFNVDLRENKVEIDVGAFCRTNGIRGRLDSSWFDSLKMTANLLKRRLKREDSLAPDEYVDDEDEPVDGSTETELDLTVQG